MSVCYIKDSVHTWGAKIPPFFFCCKVFLKCLKIGINSFYDKKNKNFGDWRCIYILRISFLSALLRARNFSGWTYLHQNRISRSLLHTQATHQVSSKSVHNFLRYPAHNPKKETDELTFKMQITLNYVFHLSVPSYTKLLVENV